MAEEKQIDEPVTDEPVTDEPAADEPAADEPAEAAAAPAPAAPAAEPAEPAPVLDPKERRRLKRSTHHGEQGQSQTVGERVAERQAARLSKAGARRRRRASERAERTEAGTGTPPAEPTPGARKLRQGRVVSAKADKTITVKIEIVRRHRVYEKVVRQTATLHAHDERNEAHEGDVVRVVESRPLSRTKRWRLVEVVERAR